MNDEMKKGLMRFDEAFGGYPEEVQEHNKEIYKKLVGRRIADLEYGPDADGDPQVYYFILDNDMKVGIARVYESGRVIEEKRTKRYADGAILRFQILNWPKSGKKKRRKGSTGGNNE